MREVRRAAIQAQKNCKETLPRARRLTKEMMLYWKKYDKVEKEHRKRAEKEAQEQRKLDEEMREVCEGERVVFEGTIIVMHRVFSHWFLHMSLFQAKRQQRKLNFLITQTELYAHFMSGKATMGGPGGDTAQEEILKKLDDSAAQRQIDIGGGVMVNMGQEDYGRNYSAYRIEEREGEKIFFLLKLHGECMWFQIVNTTSPRPWGMLKRRTRFIRRE